LGARITAENRRTGASDKEIASALGVSRSTASKHVENILKKMKATNRTAAASLSWSAER
jgi:DNA-binding NarL/FixJ family response regulator